MKLKRLSTMDFVQAFRSHLTTNFEKELFQSCLRNYSSHGNPLRFHNFAFSMRGLIDHVIARKAPVDEVQKASWFIQDNPNYKVSRRQQLKYCSQMKISDEYLGEEFLEQATEEVSFMLKLYQKLNGFTHINETSLHPDPKRFFENVKQVLETASSILCNIENCKTELIATLEDKIREAVFDTAVSCAPESLIEIANHVSIDYVEVEDFGITDIDDESIHLFASGTVSVSQEYGSKNDGATIEEDYPFTLRMVSLLESPEAFEVVSEALEVDTSSWYDDGEYEAQVIPLEKEQGTYDESSPVEEDDTPF